MSARDLLDLAGLVPLLPIIGAVVLFFFGRRLGEPKAGWVGVGAMALAFAWSVVLLAAMLSLPDDARQQVSVAFTWLPADQLQVNIGFLADPLSITWALLVTGVGTVIHVYAIGYMHGQENYGRFFAYFNLFSASMLVLVLGSSYLVTFLGWEGVGLSSYLLISFWYQRNAAAVAGKKAFIYSRVGDFGFMLAMFLMIAAFGTLDYVATGNAAPTASDDTVLAIALLLLLGAVGKSAQIPLHPWLPDAMQGPTPVSALMHAATMVTAGVFLMCRAHPFLVASPDAAAVVAWVGALTALVVGSIALLQPDIKRVLAYSTVSQLGYMFLAVGIGAYTAAIFMVLMHAFFKGTLFLGAGSVIEGNEENQDMRVMGRFRRFLPYTAFAMVIGWLAIAGIPPFAGFWAKDEILSDAYFKGDYALWIVGVLAAVITALYMTREIFMVFFGNARFREPTAEPAPVVSGGADDDEANGDDHFGIDFTVAYGEGPRPRRLGTHEPRESPAVMLVPMFILATGAVVGGLLNIPLKRLEFLDEWLAPVFRDAPDIHPTSFWAGFTIEGISVVFGLIGITIGVLLYRRGLRSPERDPLRERLGPVADTVGHGYWYDTAITRFVGGPGRRAAAWLDQKFDTGIIDGAVNGTGRLALRAGNALRRLQDGLVRRYALGIALGAVALLAFFALYAGR
jgi:NADH-quinone oxidoreductase subunit L